VPNQAMQLPLGVHTLAQLEACRLALERLADSTSAKGSSLDDFDADTQRWLAGLSEQLGAEAAARAIDDFARSATVFEIELARTPSDELTTSLVHWLRTTLDANILIRIHVQRSLIGGLRLRTGKHVYDMSLAKALALHTDRATELLRG